MIQAGIISIVPIKVAFLASRFYFYFGVFVYSYVAAMLIGQYFELSGYGTNKYYLATLAFVLSAHNFPPMPWHTTDGILFSTIAMYLLLSRKAYPILGGMTLTLAILTKQSFYVVPVIALIGCYMIHGVHIAVRATIAFLAGLAAFMAAGVMMGIFPGFLEQTTGSVTLVKLLIIVKHWISWPVTFVLLLIPILLQNLLPERYYRVYRQLFVSFVFVIVASLNAAYPLYMGSWVRDTGAWPYWALLVGVYTGCRRYPQDPKGSVVFLCLLGVSSAASISWGYITPILFSAPLVFAVFVFSRDILLVRLHWINNPIMVAVLMAGFFVSYHFPYREEPRQRLTQNLGRTAERMSFIFSSVQTQEQVEELKRLAQEYGPNLTVFPFLSLANFITNTQTSFLMDFPLDIEANFKIGALVDSLNRSSPIVLITQKYKSHCMSLARICQYVIDRWELLEKGRFFDVYRKPR